MGNFLSIESLPYGSFEALVFVVGWSVVLADRARERRGGREIETPAAAPSSVAASEVPSSPDGGNQVLKAVIDRASPAVPPAVADDAAESVGDATQRVCVRSAAEAAKLKARLFLLAAWVAKSALICAPIVAAAVFRGVTRFVGAATAFVNGIPDLVSLPFTMGILAGSLQMLVFHALHLLWQMARNPTPEWTQMTAWGKVVDVAEYLSALAPQLPAEPAGLVMLTLVSLFYAAIVFWMILPDKVDFEFNADMEREFFTVTVPRLIKSATVGARTAAAAVGASLGKPIQRCTERAPQLGGSIRQRITAVKANVMAVFKPIRSLPDASPTSAPDDVPSSSASPPTETQAVPTGTPIKKWRPTASMPSYVKFLGLVAIAACAASCALPQSGLFPTAAKVTAALPNVVQRSSHHLSEFQTAVKSNVAAYSDAAFAATSDVAVYTTARFQKIASDLSFQVSSSLGPVTSKILAAIDANVSDVFKFFVQTILQQVSFAAATSASQVSLLTETIQESVQPFVDQVTSLENLPPVLASNAYDIALANLQRATSTAAAAAEHAKSIVQLAVNSLPQAPTLRVNLGTNNTTALLPAFEWQIPPIGGMIMKLHEAIDSNVAAVVDMVTPQLASLGPASDSSISSLPPESIQETIERFIDQAASAGPLRLLGCLLWAAFVSFVYAKPEVAKSAARSGASKAQNAAEHLIEAAADALSRLQDSLRLKGSDPADSDAPTSTATSTSSKSSSYRSRKALLGITCLIAIAVGAGGPSYSFLLVKQPAAPEVSVPAISEDTADEFQQGTNLFVTEAADPHDLPSSEVDTTNIFASLGFIEDFLLQHSPTSSQGHSHDVYVALAAVKQFVRRAADMIDPPLLPVEPSTTQMYEPLLASSDECIHDVRATFLPYSNEPLAAGDDDAFSFDVPTFATTIEEPAKPVVALITRATPVQFVNHSLANALDDAVFSHCLCVEHPPALMQPVAATLPTLLESAALAPVPYINQSKTGFFVPSLNVGRRPVPMQSRVSTFATTIEEPAKSVVALITQATPVPCVNHSQANALDDAVFSIPSLRIKQHSAMMQHVAPVLPTAPYCVHYVNQTKAPTLINGFSTPSLSIGRAVEAMLEELATPAAYVNQSQATRLDIEFFFPIEGPAQFSAAWHDDESFLATIDHCGPPNQHINRTQAAKFDESFASPIRNVELPQLVLRDVEASHAMSDETDLPAFTMISEATPVQYANETGPTSFSDAVTFPTWSVEQAQVFLSVDALSHAKTEERAEPDFAITVEETVRSSNLTVATAQEVALSFWGIEQGQVVVFPVDVPSPSKTEERAEPDFAITVEETVRSSDLTVATEQEDALWFRSVEQGQVVVFPVDVPSHSTTEERTVPRLVPSAPYAATHCVPQHVHPHPEPLTSDDDSQRGPPTLKSVFLKHYGVEFAPRAALGFVVGQVERNCRLVAHATRLWREGELVLLR